MTTSPVRAIVGQPAPELSVELVDGTGATLAAAAADVRVRLVGGSSQLSGQIQRPLDAGKATFNDLRVGTPGVYRLEASVATSGRTITAVTPEFPVSPRPVLLDSASTNAIGDSLGTQVVISGAGASQAFDSGTVIVGTSGQGFIREVLGRAAAGGAVVLRTRPATLNQVIQNGGFTTTMALRGPAGGGDGRGASGNDVAAVTMPFDATFSFGKVSIDDPMSGSSVSVTAGVTFSGSATLDAQFAGFRTKHFLFAVDGQLALTADYAATIRAGLAAQKTFRPDAPLFRVSRLVPVNGWPVLVTSTGRVSFTASAHGGQAINVQGTPQVGRSFHLASEYAGDGWTNTQSSQPLANAPPSSVAPTGAVVLDLGLGLEAKVVVDVALYDLAGVYAFALAHGDVNLTADMPAYMARLMCEASAGVGAGIGFTEDVKDFIADHHLPFGIELPALEFSAPIPGKQFCNESFEFTPTREVRISNLPSVITLGGSVVAAAQPYVVWGGQPVPAARPVTWASSRADVASVSSGGEVKGLAIGQARISAANGAAVGSVDVQVASAATSVVRLNPASVQFTAVRLGAIPAAQSASVTASSGPISALTTSISYTDGSGWLTATLSGPATPATLLLRPATADLAVGSYRAVVGVAGSGAAAATLLVSYDVDAAGAPPPAPTIALSESPANLSMVQGSASPQRTVQVTNGGGGTLNGLTLGQTSYAASQPAGWLDAGLSRTEAPASLALSVNNTTLGPGTYTAVVPIRSAAPGVTNSPLSLTVNLVVTAVTPVARVEIAPVAASIPVGGTVQFAATAYDVNGGVVAGASATYQWSALDAAGPAATAIATVSSSGLATGVGPGRVAVRATVGSTTSSAATLTVTAASGSLLLSTSGMPPSITEGGNCYIDVAGITGPRTLAGPFRVARDAAVTIANLEPGNYTIPWGNAPSCRPSAGVPYNLAYVGNPVAGTATVSPGVTTVSTYSMAVNAAVIHFSASGLPSSCKGAVQVRLPNSASFTLDIGTQTYDGDFPLNNAFEPGQYVVTWLDYGCSGVTYHPANATITVTLSASATPVSVSTVYAP